MVIRIRRKISLPLIVGGGISSVDKAGEIYKAGADMIVVGTVLEHQPELVKDFCALRNELNG